MKIITGLGNPEKKYEFTRHNIGFWVIAAFAEKNNFPGFKLSKKFNALISENIINNEKIILAKPQTFMNESGKAIKSILDFNKTGTAPAQTRAGTAPAILILIHDDIDLPIGEIKVSQNRGSAGHKGVESIIQKLGTKNFSRIRIGILPQTGKPENVEKFVLEKFSESEKEILKKAIEQVISALENQLYGNISRS